MWILCTAEIYPSLCVINQVEQL